MVIKGYFYLISFFLLFFINSTLFFSGQIILWDYSSSTVIKAIPGVHSCPVVHLTFLNDYSKLISGDVNGEVHKSTLSYRLMYYSVDTVKILGSNSGVIYSLEALPSTEPLKPIDEFNLIAIASAKAVSTLY